MLATTLTDCPRQGSKVSCYQIQRLSVGHLFNPPGKSRVRLMNLLKVFLRRTMVKASTHDFRSGRRVWSICTLLLLVMASGLGLSAHAADKFSSRQIQQVQELSAATLAKDGLPGLSVAVAKGDQIWSAGFGSANLEQNVAVDSRSLFRTASISKWLTATAAMRLMEEGKLDLDAPVQQYCPQYPQKQWNITSRQLLSHLSGIRHYHGANEEPRNTEAERKALGELIKQEECTQYTRHTDIVSTLDSFKDDPLVFQPGTHFL